MPQELAIQKTSGDWAVDCLSSLKPLIEQVTPHESGYTPEAILKSLASVTENFESDLNRVSTYASMLFGPDVSHYGEQATEIFNLWATTPGGGPSLTAFLVVALDHMKLPTIGPIVNAAMLASVMAEVPNDLLYHGNEHYKKVMFHTIRLLSTHRLGHFAGLPSLHDDAMMKVLIASTIHDLGHEGGDNLRNEIYTPGYMEQKAFDMMRPYFVALDIERDFWGDIESIIFCTDITFFAGDNSPCARMKKIYRYFFMNDLNENEDIGMMMMGKLRRFEDNPRLSLMAMLLHEADIATSAGLSYEQSRSETIKIMEERGVKTAGPKVLLRFLTEQLDGHMITPAAQKIFGPAMSRIMHQAQQDRTDGVETFY